MLTSGIDDADGCAELLDWLSKSGIQCTLLAARPMYRHMSRRGVSTPAPKHVGYFSSPGTMWRPISGAFLFARIISELRALHRTQRIDLLHAHGLLPCGHAALLLNRELSIPYVVSLYGVDELSTSRNSGRVQKWCHRIAQHVFAESRRVVCVSEQVRERVLERTGRPCRTSVVYHGVDPELFSPAPELSGPTPTVLSGGNLSASEGHDLLIRATAVLVKEFPSILLEIIGEGPQRSHLQRLAEKLGVAGQVHLVGHQSRREIADAMKRCILFALPSQAQESARLQMQAMSCGKAVIGCRQQGIAEIIRHATNGFLVGPDNEKELMLAMGMLLREPQRRGNLGAAARQTILDRHTVEQQAENLRRIYRESVA
jgi:teichuronic acid biosynthesis glycosyltransferase TuaC